MEAVYTNITVVICIHVGIDRNVSCTVGDFAQYLGLPLFLGNVVHDCSCI